MTIEHFPQQSVGGNCTTFRPQRSSSGAKVLYLTKTFLVKALHNYHKGLYMSSICECLWGGGGVRGGLGGGG